MSGDSRRGGARWEAALRGAAAAASCVFGLIFLGLALLRLGYPFGLEWMEGGSLDAVHRILAGEAIYGPPSLDFVPFIYTPLYFAAAAAFSSLVGTGFPVLRGISLLSTLGVFAVLFRCARRESGSLWSGLIAAGTFAGTYAASGAWLDLGRVDALFLFLLMAGADRLLAPDTRRNRLAAGLLLALSFLTKQTAALAAAPLLLLAGVRRRGRSIEIFLPLVLLAGGVSLFLDLRSEGWYGYWIFLPSSDPWMTGAVAGFWLVTLLPTLPVALLLVACLVTSEMRRGDEERGWSYFALLLGCVGASWLSWVRTGAFASVLMPAHAALALLAGIGAHRLRGRGSVERRASRALLLSGAAVAQLALLAYDPRPFVPSAADREAGRHVIAILRDLPGEVWIPQHAYLSRLAGKRTYGGGNAGGDVFRGGDERVSERYYAEIAAAIRERRFEAIVLDESPISAWSGIVPLFGAEIERGYAPGAPLFTTGDVFFPPSGARTRPDRLLVRRLEGGAR